jgi:hypothetical protein
MHDDLNLQLLRDRVFDVMNRIVKWRSILAGWQLGTRPKTDGACRAVRDHRELSMLTRVDVNAITNLLLKKGLITEKELLEQTLVEAEAYEKGLQARFPGLKATDEGMSLQMPLAAETLKKYNFPP